MDENILSDKLPEVKIPVYGLFPTPIGVYSVPNHQQLKEEVTTYISMLKPEDAVSYTHLTLPTTPYV